MKKYDVRCYVSQALKKQIKLYTLNNNMSINRWLLNLIENDLNGKDFQTDTTELNDELQKILMKLSNSANLTVDEREQLKNRKKQIKNLLKGETNNG